MTNNGAGKATREAGLARGLRQVAQPPERQSDIFTGRDAVLKKLEEFFIGHDRRRKFLMHGLGGSGKTELALTAFYGFAKR